MLKKLCSVANDLDRHGYLSLADTIDKQIHQFARGFGHLTRPHDPVDRADIEKCIKSRIFEQQGNIATHFLSGTGCDVCGGHQDKCFDFLGYPSKEDQEKKTNEVRWYMCEECIPYCENGALPPSKQK